MDSPPQKKFLYEWPTTIHLLPLIYKTSDAFDYWIITIILDIPNFEEIDSHFRIVECMIQDRSDFIDSRFIFLNRTIDAI